MSAVEINMGKKIDEALVKGLTGGDRITARFLGKEFFEFAPQAKFFGSSTQPMELPHIDCDADYKLAKSLQKEVTYCERDRFAEPWAWTG